MRSSSSSSHRVECYASVGRGLLLTSSTVTNLGQMFRRCPNWNRVVRAAISFAGARKQKCKRLEMMRSRNALTWRL
ncbi:hypothetical protein SESBI_15784 [Sesbania bispinosa]|nr:hypothetical protein SESBI_15784 [Sesbania bispinosa]